MAPGVSLGCHYPSPPWEHTSATMLHASLEIKSPVFCHQTFIALLGDQVRSANRGDTDNHLKMTPQIHDTVGLVGDSRD